MTKDYVAVLDACCLVGAGLRDTLLRLAETPRLYVPKWTDEIIAETARTLTGKRFGYQQNQTDHLISELQRAFPEAWVYGYKVLEAGLENDPKDRHVLAATIKCGAQQIVTFNLKDFPESVLAPFDNHSKAPRQVSIQPVSSRRCACDTQIRRASTGNREIRRGTLARLSPNQDVTSFYADDGRRIAHKALSHPVAPRHPPVVP